MKNTPVSVSKLPGLGIDLLSDLRSKLIKGRGCEKIENIYPHEDILEERAHGLITYIESLKPWVIVPSILICDTTNVIIDGHHRYYVLKTLGYTLLPVTYVRYTAPEIITHDKPEKRLMKDQIIRTGTTGDLLQPKSSMHHCVADDLILPIILLSDLRVIEHG